MKLILIVFTFTIMIFGQCKYDSVDEIINRWDKRDGEEEYILSLKLSKNIIINDSLFFKKMKNNGKIYEEWLSNLQYTVFTIFDYEDSVDIILKTAYYEKLKNLMLEKANKYKNNTSFGKLAIKMIKKLAKIKIRIID